MKNDIAFSTPFHAYVYSFRHKEYLPLHPILKRIYTVVEEKKNIEEDEELRCYPKEQILHYLQKYKFLKENEFISEKVKTEFGEITETMVRREVENLTVLTFEVTERCNLRCRYCAFGDLYYGYDERKGENLDFPKAKQILDFLFGIWEKIPHLSVARTLTVGFYGGEPLMNMDLIKQIVSYIDEHKPEGMKFAYNMTTNAMLLRVYQDFLVEHKFHLLVSLDGTEADDCHRVTVNGKSSFAQVFEQIKNLQFCYPEYFKKYVSFNSVIHSESNIERIVDFFRAEFDKQTSLSELNNSSIAQEGKYAEMRKSVFQSIALSPRRKEIDQQLMYNAPDISTVTYFLHHLSNEVFRDYRSMFYGKRNFKLLPTGTCIPFNRKMYVTVHGKILVCERIDHDFAVGHVTDEGVELNFAHVAENHRKYCSKLLSQCKQCYMQESCSQCMYYTNVLADKVVCRNFKNREMFAGYLAMNVDYLEHNRWAYSKVMKEIFIF
jgi:hypothetical protein